MSTAAEAGGGQRLTGSHRLDLDDPRLRSFWQERHLSTVTTLTSTGRPHTVPVAPTLDPDRGVLRILSSRGSQKIRNVATSSDTAWVSVCQVDGRRWCTLNGVAHILSDREAVADAERRYTTRFRAPRPNPERVVLLITIETAIGTLR